LWRALWAPPQPWLGCRVLARGRTRNVRVAAARTLQKERVVGVARRMRLWLKERVKVPERALHKVVGRHLREAVSTKGRSVRHACGAISTRSADGARRHDPLAHPISKKILRNSSRTLSSGWKWPLTGGTPFASKLYFLNCVDFQAPLRAGTANGEHVHRRTYISNGVCDVCLRARFCTWRSSRPSSP